MSESSVTVKRRRWRIRYAFALLLAVGVVAVGLTRLGTAQAENVVNVTFHVPAQPTINPCTAGDVINLNGDIHIVMTSTANTSGGFTITNSMNSKFTGSSIVTGVNYVSSENKNTEEHASPPYPWINTSTYDWDVVSQNNTPNYVLHMTLHTTVTANGVPAATVDNWMMGCKG